MARLHPRWMGTDRTIRTTHGLARKRGCRGRRGLARWRSRARRGKKCSRHADLGAKLILSTRSYSSLCRKICQYWKKPHTGGRWMPAIEMQETRCAWQGAGSHRQKALAPTILFRANWPIWSRDRKVVLSTLTSYGCLQPLPLQAMRLFGRSPNLARLEGLLNSGPAETSCLLCKRHKLVSLLKGD